MRSKYADSSKYALHQSIKATVAPLAVAITSALTAGSLQAATITVNTLDDGLLDDFCSLRSALYTATNNLPYQDCALEGAGDDVIVFDPALNGTIQLQAGAAVNGYGADDSSLPVGESVTINGDERITVSGTGNGRVFDVLYNAMLGMYAEEVTFSNITISNGGGEEIGGGIRSAALYLNLDNVSLNNNSAGVAGGGLHHNPGGANACAVVPTFGQNRGGEPLQCPASLSIINSSFNNNSSIVPIDGGGGGAVYAELDSEEALFISLSTFSGNSAAGGSGGAVNVQQQYSEITIEYSAFDNNEAEYSAGDGGAVHARLKYSQATLNSNYFDANTASQDGGAVFMRGDLLTPQIAEFSLHQNQFSANQAGRRGGGLHAEVTGAGKGTRGTPATTLEIVDSEFRGNIANASGGGLSLISENAVSSTISESTFSNNTAKSERGGGVYVESESGLFLVYESVISENVAPSGAGIGFAGGSSSTIQFNESAFANNNASVGCGGGLDVTGSPESVSIYSSIFRENEAGGCGGAISVVGNEASPTTVSVKYSELSGNTAAGTQARGGPPLGGGALFVSLGMDSNTRISNSTISSNSLSSIYGGGMHFTGDMTAQLKYSTIANNYAIDDGGGLFNQAGDCGVSDSLFTNNSIAGGTAQDMTGTGSCSVNDSLLSGASASTFTDVGGNILDVDALVGPLTDNGGPTRTHALLPGSPAIDEASAGDAITSFDQRGEGFPRIVGSAPDMGSFELLVDGIFSDRFEQASVVSPSSSP